MKNTLSFTIMFGAVAMMLTGIPSTASADLVAHYTFDNTLADTTGNHNGTMNGTANYVSGINGEALQFDGVSNYVTLANSTNILFGRDYSISVWIQYQSLESGQQAILDKTVTNGWAPPGKQWLVYNSSGELYNDCNGTGGFEADFPDIWGTSVTDGSWHHCVCAYSDETMPHRVWYMDGQPIVDTATWLSAPDTSNQVVQIGARDQALYFSGVMDDLQIYSQTLTSNQVQYLLNNPGSTLANDPNITTAPQSQDVEQGNNATFTAVAGGTPPFTYQWYFNAAGTNGIASGTNAIPIANATNASLTLTGVTTNQTGIYTILVSNSVGTMSQMASLLVYLPAVFSTQVYPGLAIQGTVGMTYQIQQVGVLLGGANWQSQSNATVTLPNSPYYWFDLQPSPTNEFYRAAAALSP